MNSCNCRGFLELDGNKFAVIRGNKDKFLKVEDGYVYVFNKNFDAFQNGIISIISTEQPSPPLPIFLRCSQTSVDLGTTAYPLFLNSSLPISYPFFTFLDKSNRYLFIPSKRNDLEIFVCYDGLNMKQSTKNSLSSQNKYEYYSFILCSHNLFLFEKNSNVCPIENDITYETDMGYGMSVDPDMV